MLPHEDENRRGIQGHFGEDFALSATLLSECVRFLDQVRQVDMGVANETKAFVLGTMVREIRRYRSIVAECELGLLENAFGLMRTMYEGMLSLRYVLGATLPTGKQSPGLRQRLKELPPPLANMKTPDFRARQYFAKAADTALRLADDIGENDSGEADRCRDVRGSVPEPWQVAQRKAGNFSGLSIAQLAEYCGVLDVHRRLYYLECHVTHANDAVSFVRVDDDGNAWVQLATEVGQTRLLLCLASGILFQVVQTVETAFGCDANMETVFQKYQCLKKE